MNERWHTVGFTCKDAWVRQPQNEVSLSSLGQFRRRGQEGSLEPRGKTSPGCALYPSREAPAKPQPLPDTQRCLELLTAFCLLLSYPLITSLSVIVPHLFSHCSAYCSVVLLTAAVFYTLISRKPSHTHAQIYTYNGVYMPFAYYSNIFCETW